MPVSATGPDHRPGGPNGATVRYLDRGGIAPAIVDRDDDSSPDRPLPVAGPITDFVFNEPSVLSLLSRSARCHRTGERVTVSVGSNEPVVADYISPPFLTIYTVERDFGVVSPY
jgi:hypothetical protein